MRPGVVPMATRDASLAATFRTTSRHTCRTRLFPGNACIVSTTNCSAPCREQARRCQWCFARHVQRSRCASPASAPGPHSPQGFARAPWQRCTLAATTCGLPTRGGQRPSTAWQAWLCGKVGCEHESTHTSASLRVHTLPDKLASPNARCHVSQCCQTRPLQFLTTWEGRQSQEHLKAHGKRLSEHVSACQLTKSTPFPST